MLIYLTTFIILFFVKVSNATPIFQEDFESYAEGSDLVGQGGWQHWSASSTGSVMVSSINTSLGTKVVDGTQKMSNDIFFYSVSDLLTLRNDITNISLDNYITFSYDTYVEQGPKNSGIGFYDSSSNTPVVIRHKGFGNVGFEVDIGPVLTNTPLPALRRYHVDFIIDGFNNEFYAKYDDGFLISETDHFSITDDLGLIDISGIMFYQDYRNGKTGVEFDNIVLSTTPIPEPSTIILISYGIVMFFLFRVRGKGHPFSCKTRQI